MDKQLHDDLQPDLEREEEPREPAPLATPEEPTTFEMLKEYVHRAVERAEAQHMSIAEARDEIARRVQEFGRHIEISELLEMGQVRERAEERLNDLRDEADRALHGEKIREGEIREVAVDADERDPGVDFAFDHDADAAPEVAARAPIASVVGEGEISGMLDARERAGRARLLLNIAKLRDRGVSAVEAQRMAELAETKGVLDHGTIRRRIGDAIRGAAGENAMLATEAIEEIAELAGLPEEEIERIVRRQEAALEDRAREEVRREQAGGIKRTALAVAGYAGLASALEHIVPGLGSATAAVRVVRLWRRGKVEDRQVRERVDAFRSELHRTALPDGAVGLAEQFETQIAAELALAQQRTIDRTTDLDLDIFRVVNETDRYLADTTTLSEEQRKRFSDAAVGLFKLEERTAALEASCAAHPSVSEKLFARMDRVFESKVLRGGTTGDERALTAAVFGAAGVLARGIPVVRNILMGYAGMKAGEVAAQFATQKAGAFEVLQPINPAALAGETVDGELLTRARVQLMDSTYKRVKPAEWQQLREHVDRHESVLLYRAENALTAAADRGQAMEDAMVERRKRKGDRAFIVNAARVGGAITGAFLGPELAQILVEKLRAGVGTVMSGLTEAEPTPLESGPGHAVAYDPPYPEAADVGSAAGLPSAEMPHVDSIESPLPVEPVAPVAGEDVAVEDQPTTEPVAPLEQSAVAPELYELSTFKEGEGLTHVLLRQLKADPVRFGFSGDVGDPRVVSRWAMTTAKDIAIREGYLDADRITTTHGLRSAGGDLHVVLQLDGSVAYEGEYERFAYHHVAGDGSPAGHEVMPADRVAEIVNVERPAIARKVQQIIRDLHAYNEAPRARTDVIANPREYSVTFGAANQEILRLEISAKRMPDGPARSVVLGEVAQLREALEPYRAFLPSAEYLESHARDEASVHVEAPPEDLPLVSEEPPSVVEAPPSLPIAPEEPVAIEPPPASEASPATSPLDAGTSESVADAVEATPFVADLEANAREVASAAHGVEFTLDRVPDAVTLDTAIGNFNAAPDLPGKVAVLKQLLESGHQVKIVADLSIRRSASGRFIFWSENGRDFQPLTRFNLPRFIMRISSTNA